MSCKPRVTIAANWEQVKNDTCGQLKTSRLNTICAEGACPNISECWSKKHAAFMILGDVCTRRCTFCYVKKGRPNQIDEQEPENLAQTVFDMGLKHVVITSVTRDDLKDGGSTHFKNCIDAIRAKYKAADKKITIEVLTPDFRRKEGALEIVLAAAPDVYNHNIETIPRLYSTVRLGANYMDSLSLLKAVKEKSPTIFTKSGLMLGLGEKEEEVIDVLKDLRAHGVDFVTIGQYLQPTKKHHEVLEYASIEKFEFFKAKAKELGFLMISSSPLTRSSYHADEDFEIMVQKRIANL